MLQGILLITVIGFLAGEVAGKLKLPKLIGMIIAGMIVGPYLFDILPEEILEFSEEIRLFVLLIILFKAGLGLDKDKLMAQGSVALRLGFLPAVIETFVVALTTRWLLGWEWLLCFLLGWIICAASPAVIVPLMLRLKARGWGSEKGIPDLILAGGTISDAVAVTMFGITLGWVLGETDHNLWLQAGSIPLQILLAVIAGYLAGRLVLSVIKFLNISGKPVQELIISLGFALLLLIGSEFAPYSNFLAIMVMGFIILETNAVVARRLRAGVDHIWQVGEIFLFVLIGAAVNIYVVLEAGFYGLIIIAIGLIVGRWAGIFLSTWGSNITIGERVFMVVGDMAKATVQAAIAGIPLAMGVAHGEYILAIGVLAILVSAPIGAFGTIFLAPRLLEKGKIDPTKVNIKENYSFLVAMEESPSSRMALKEAARVARPVDARLIIVNFFNQETGPMDYQRLKEELEIVSDIEHEVVVDKGDPVEIILNTALKHGVDYIYMGKTGSETVVGNISQRVIEKSPLPVILIESEPGMGKLEKN
jgi:NhaP-type Na+/H+ or K+/H+ antiporter